MTPRRAGWIAGVIALAALTAALAWAIVVDPHLTGLGNGTVTAFDAFDLPGPLAFAFVVGLLLVLFGVPFAIAVGVVVARSIRAASGDDGPERFLALATAGLSGSRAEWGAAMRAELAAVDEPEDRRRFARSAGASALRSLDASQWLVASLGGLAVVLLTLVSSAILLHVTPDTGFFVAVARALLLLAVAWLVAARERSFRRGLETGLLALLIALLGIFAVTAIEAVVWADLRGTFIFDDDPPRDGVMSPGRAVADALTPMAIWLHLVWLSPWPVFGALAGRRLARRNTDAVAEPFATVAH